MPCPTAVSCPMRGVASEPAPAARTKVQPSGDAPRLCINHAPATSFATRYRARSAPTVQRRFNNANDHVLRVCPPPPSPTHPVSPARNVREPGGRRASHSTEPSRAEHHHDRRGSRTRLQDSRPQIAGLIPPKWRSFAAVAQLAARRSHNPKVGSSILSCRILYLPTPRLGKGQPPPRTRIVFSP